MTPETLIAEGRRLARRCVFLREEGDGPVAAFWHHHAKSESDAAGQLCWITVDASFIPGLTPVVDGYVTIYTDTTYKERKLTGTVGVTSSPPHRPGIALRAREERVLPPIEAVFALGSDAVGQWLKAHGWPRDERYNDNFPDRAVVQEYERVFQGEYPVYHGDTVYAMLGGWHLPGADGDWYTLMDEQLLVLTIRDAEPWVEAWRTRAGQVRVIQRMT